MKGNEISFLHKQTLTPISFLAGSVIVIPENTTRVPSTSRPQAPPAPRKPTLPKPAVRTPTRPAKNPADYSRAPMTQAEKVHFHSGKARRRKLFAKLEPVVKAYAREQSRKPAEVSLRLNADGYATAVGAAWTPRLVHFLLALIQRSQARRQTRGPATEAGPTRAGETATADCDEFRQTTRARWPSASLGSDA